MSLPNIFNKEVSEKVIQRIEQLKPSTQAKWGKMSVDQVLAHCNVSYELVYDNIHPKPNFFMGFILKTFVKNIVVSETPYKKSSQTAPEFIMKGDKNFEAEKTRLIEYIKKTQQLGETTFDNKVSNSFGKLTATEWSNLFYKHLDHHLNQFGV
ncbi:MAG: DUF1569 domain-containing protein [Sphingobacteriales bacterium]|nr:MAG: DUF1569 domain-containing protein [Sphingobacteriales bacterium]TAF81973.1 MAG: DUF1569 domain-containing protein [Sphingobacteriales bacterium]